MITKLQYFNRNNYTGLICLFSIFLIASVWMIVHDGVYVVNPWVWVVPYIFVTAIILIFVLGGRAYKRYKALNL